MTYVFFLINDRFLIIKNHRLINDNEYLVNVLFCTSSRCQSFNLSQLFFNKILNDQLFRRR